MIDHLNLKLLIFVGKLQVLRFDLKKFRIFEIMNFHPCNSKVSEILDHLPYTLFTSTNVTWVLCNIDAK